MKKLWLLMFPICMLLSCLTDCRRPLGGAISTWAQDGTPVEPPYIYLEVGGNYYFLANYRFQIYWCNGVNCTPDPSQLGPCTKQVVGKGHEKPHGKDKEDRYVGKCVIATGASTHHDYHYVFYPSGKKLSIKDLPRYDFPDNLQPCNPRCSPKSE